MRKKFKIQLSIFSLILLIVFSSFILKKQLVQSFNGSTNDNNINLVSDSSNYNVLPKNFRKTSNLESIKNNKDLNLKGLDKLNISGSAQPSKFNLPILIKSIDTSLPIKIVDLRQESHGFINGIPVSWDNKLNNANMGLSKKQVLMDENKKLQNIKLNTPITFSNHNLNTVIPKQVESEDSLIGCNSSSYFRVPITDGKIPTDEMVDHFVKLVKHDLKDSWIHFHCKEGVGRTTTFMIMYDMMKNYNKATADEIIKRQLALSGLKESNIKSFYNNKRISFLNDFYKYCQQNGKHFKTKWSKWKNSLGAKSTSIGNFSNTSIYKSTSNYIKNPTTPTFLYVLYQNKMTSSERTMIATLQGIVNGHCSSQIYTLNSSQPDYNIWLEDLRNNYGISYKIVSNPWDLLHIYNKYISGYVLYNNKSKKDPSINNACSLASLKNSIAVDESIKDKVKSYGITKMKGDCTNTDNFWAYNHLWNHGLNHSIVIELSPEKSSSLRDYAIMTKSLIFYEDSIDDTTLRDKVFSSMKNKAICLGWGPDEFINVSTASKYGVSMIPADWSYNLTTLSAFPSLHMYQKNSLNVPKDKSMHYVTFIMSDGDNQQWYLGNNYNSPKWFGSSYRKNLNIGWSISPSLYYLAPTVFNLYYKNSKNNYFVVSPSGNGYVYPSKFEKSKLNLYINDLNKYMKKVNQEYITVIDDGSFENKNLWSKFTQRSNINGIFYLDYHIHNKYKGKILWSNNKPIVSCRDLLWDGIENENQLVKNINSRVNMGKTNTSNPNAYTFVYVHAWSKNLNDVNNVINKLNKNPKIKVVTPEIFMELLDKNIKR